MRDSLMMSRYRFWIRPVIVGLGHLLGWSVGLGLGPASAVYAAESAGAAAAVAATPSAPVPVKVAADSGCRGESMEAASCVIDRLHTGLGVVLAQGLDFENRCRGIAPPVVAAYDLDFMAVRSLGARGRKLSSVDRERWVAAFTRFTVATYARRFKDASAPLFETLAVTPARKETVLVRSRIVRTATDAVAIDYRMHLRDGQWRIVDVYAGGTISELALRRAEVGSLLATMSFDEVVTFVDDSSANP